MRSTRTRTHGGGMTIRRESSPLRFLLRSLASVRTALRLSRSQTASASSLSHREHPHLPSRSLTTLKASPYRRLTSLPARLPTTTKRSTCAQSTWVALSTLAKPRLSHTRAPYSTGMIAIASALAVDLDSIPYGRATSAAALRPLPHALLRRRLSSAQCTPLTRPHSRAHRLSRSRTTAIHAPTLQL